MAESYWKQQALPFTPVACLKQNCVCVCVFVWVCVALPTILWSKTALIQLQSTAKEKSTILNAQTSEMPNGKIGMRAWFLLVS